MELVVFRLISAAMQHKEQNKRQSKDLTL